MTNRRRDSPEHHFWQYVTDRGPDECWEWSGPLQTKSVYGGGYGVFDHQFKRYYAHRFSWEIHNGPIPEGMCICHRCDNPPCVNPNHLFLGTHSDNMKDACHKGHFRGERNGQAKLTEQQVKEIRIRYNEGNILHRELAKEYGVSRRTIGRAIKRQDWGWLK